MLIETMTPAPAAAAGRWMRKLLRVVRYGPGAWGRERRRRAEALARERAFGPAEWQLEEGFVRRRYACYDAYVEHQAAKLARIRERLDRHDATDHAVFLDRFRSCRALRDARVVLCLGARLGTEVRALHELGTLAFGIDLNPGADNPHVLPGDFHAIRFPDASFDAVYTNALDHAFDLARVIDEVERLLRPGGAFVTDVVAGYEAGFTPGPYEAVMWPDIDALAGRIAARAALELEDRRPVPGFGQAHWVQLVFRKQEGSGLSARHDHMLDPLTA
jgi:SAM-dependent methyltransferase